MNKNHELIHILLEIVKGFFISMKMLISVLPKLLSKLFDFITDRLRFSISFKITTFYASIFFFFLLLSNIAAVSGFIYFMQKHIESVSPNFNQGFLYIKFIGETVEVHKYIVILSSILLGSDILFLFMMIGMGSSVSKRMLLPVKKMTETVKQISIQDLNTRLDVKGSKDELKDLAKTFNDMLDRLQKSVETQNQFVSDASHELRTPIAVIQGYANLLDRWGKEDKAVLNESIDAIKSEAESMKDLMENLLFLARSDKHTQKVEMLNFPINELIDEILRETKLIDLSHKIFCERNESLMFYGDRNLLKEAIRVFVDNSLKYTLEGGIVKINSYAKNNKLVIEVEDNGVGISKEDLPHIFDRFYRVDKSRTKETGGTGLGLSIAKWIILKHKGTIEVTSKLGFGTKISILLPIDTNTY